MERARRVWRLPANPVAGVEKPRSGPVAGGLAVLTSEEVRRLVDAAADGQDAAIYLTAAFTGLRRGELIALRWSDIDFEGACVRVTSNYVNGHLTSPKSGRVRTVPMAPAVARALERLHDGQAATQGSELVFPGTAGGYLDASALLRRYKAALRRAGLNPLRFHDLRHVFGTAMIRRVDIVRLQEWMGHADIQTTRQYLHYASRPDDARTVAEALAEGGDVDRPPSKAPESEHDAPANPATPSGATHAPAGFPFRPPAPVRRAARRGPNVLRTAETPPPEATGHDDPDERPWRHEPVRLLTADETAELLRVPRSTIYALTRERRMPFVKIGRRTLFHPEALSQWIADSMVPVRRPSRSSRPPHHS